MVWQNYGYYGRSDKDGPPSSFMPVFVFNAGCSSMMTMDAECCDIHQDKLQSDNATVDAARSISGSFFRDDASQSFPEVPNQAHDGTKDDPSACQGQINSGPMSKLVLNMHGRSRKSRRRDGRSGSELLHRDPKP